MNLVLVKNLFVIKVFVYVNLRMLLVVVVNIMNHTINVVNYDKVSSLLFYPLLYRLDKSY